jgi:multidrug efflux pump subunit AcrA (membrane-fusion protein)
MTGLNISYIKNHKRIMIALLIAVLVLVIAVPRVMKKTVPVDLSSLTKTVSAVAVDDFSSGTGRVSADGTVESQAQAELRSQVIAPVAKINVSIGDKVFTGQSLVTLQGTDVNAQLAQAEAGLTAQKARLQDMLNGARREDLNLSETDVRTANQVLSNAYMSVSNSLNDAYIKADDAVRKQIASMYANAEDSNPTLSFSVSDYQLKVSAESGRVQASRELNMWRSELDSISDSSTSVEYDAVITKSKAHLSSIRNILNVISSALTTALNLSQVTLDGYKAMLNVGRGNVNGALSSVTSLEQGLIGLRLAVERVQGQLALKVAGTSNEGILAQQAVVEQSQAAVDNLRAQVAKTVIRSPIEGTVASVPVRVGELMTMGQLVASVVSVDSLQIKLYVSDSDVGNFRVGDPVVISATAKGTVSNISPSIDSKTKKVEVKVLVTSPKDASLVVGQNVTVVIAGTNTATSSVSYFLPIQVVKIDLNTAAVYSVDSQSVVTEVPVTLGKVVGETVEVTGGIKPGMVVVSPSFELKTGDTVVIKK